MITMYDSLNHMAIYRDPVLWKTTGRPPNDDQQFIEAKILDLIHHTLTLATSESHGNNLEK